MNSTPTQRTAVVTGTTHGIGAALEHRLLDAGWQLITINRSAAPPGDGVQRITAELAEPASTHDAITAVRETDRFIDLLINNAGVLLPEHHYTATGFEHHYTVNTLAPYLLATGLKDRLAAGSAVITVSSFALFRAGPLNLDTLIRPTGSVRKLFGIYAQSKLATSMTTAALATDYAAAGITLRSIDPGPTRSNMTASSGLPMYLRPWRPFFTSADKAAASILRVAADKPGDAGHTYLTSKRTPKALPDHARDPHRQQLLLDRLEHDRRSLSSRPTRP